MDSVKLSRWISCLGTSVEMGKQLGYLDVNCMVSNTKVTAVKVGLIKTYHHIQSFLGGGWGIGE